MQALSNPPQLMTVPTRFGNTHVTARGPRDAPPVVLIPAMGVTSTMWEPNLPALSRAYRTLSVDTIGDLGLSVLTSPAVYPRNGKAYSEWLVDLFNELSIRQADLVGASLGGWIAMNHAIYAPERVRRLVLLGPMGLPSWWTTLKVLSHLWRVFLLPSRSNIDRTIRWALGDHPQVRAVFTPLLKAGVQERAKIRLAPPLHLTAARLRKITSPTLLFLGERDNPIGNPDEVADRARRYISGAQVEILPGAGHMMNMEMPDIVNSRILCFLESEPWSQK